MEYLTKSPEYYKTYHKKNYDKFHCKHTCNICGGTYNYYSKAKHLRTNKHKRELEIKQLKERLN